MEAESSSTYATGLILRSTQNGPTLWDDNHTLPHLEDAANFFLNLKCLTRNLETVVCSWDTPPNSTDLETVYEICSRSSNPERCFETKERQLETEFEIIAPLNIKIKAKNFPDTPEISFRKTMEDIPYVPPPPQIISLVSDSQFNTLQVAWSMDISTFLSGEEVECEIQILRSENFDLITTASWTKRWNVFENLFHWNWTSDFPLLCTSHSVRVRCKVNDVYYTGKKEFSEWSPVQTIYGSTETMMYPVDKVVAVGSNITFCCTVKDGIQINSIELGDIAYELIHLGRNSSAIQLHNMNMSEESGDNCICYTNSSFEFPGTVVFVGYPPDTPQNFHCETRNLKIIECSWEPGRNTGLKGERETKYTLYESYSGTNISCENMRGDQYICSCNIHKDQNLYTFLLEASNPLGRSEAFFAINATERIYPETPKMMSIQNVSPTEVSLSWFLDGNFASLKLLCEIEIKKASKESEMRNATLHGSVDSNYKYTVDHLHPYHGYEFRVRCSSYDHFWKWSNWSKRMRHLTLSAVPSKKLDIWREVTQSPERRTIYIYWKHLTINEANGQVHSYKLSWRPLKSDLEQHDTLSAAFNKTQINLDSSDERDYEIVVVANNSAGLSPSSRITTIQLPSDAGTERVVGEASGINITWQSDANVSCGYLVQWRPSSLSHSSNLMWRRFHSNITSTFISSDQFLAGVRYNVSVFGCIDNKYKLLKKAIGYTEELSPRVPLNFTVEETTSNSVQLRWDLTPVDDLRGFLRGYLVYALKQENDTPPVIFMDFGEHAQTKNKMINLTNPAVRTLKIKDLHGGTSYHLGLQAYTGGGRGPIKWSNVVTNDNAVGLILAILIPIVVAVLLGIVTSTICYQKREWIKETFYPDIPNPENSKALQFQKNVSEGNKGVKTLEMNPCTPNNVEVVETFSTVPKILDTGLNSPVPEDPSSQFPDDDTEDENHVVVSYCPSSANEDTSNVALDESTASSQVVYIDIQSMYQPQSNSEEEPESKILDSAGGYKPQMQLQINSVKTDSLTPAEDNFDASAGYRPQENPNTWAVDSADSPTSLGSNSENASFGSPCSITSRHFLIPPVDDKDSLKPTHVGWSLSSIFQNKQEE
ncbi:leukemia inhibitory factor receptor [Rhinophrynus dorsalis]